MDSKRGSEKETKQGRVLGRVGKGGYGSQSNFP